MDRFTTWVTRQLGSTTAVAAAAVSVLVWMAGGFVVGFSDTYQLVINTGTTIVTFLMVFIIQRTQNRHEAAIQLKLDELVHAVDGARNKIAGVEEKTLEEIEELKHENHA